MSTPPPDPTGRPSPPRREPGPGEPAPKASDAGKGGKSRSSTHSHQQPADSLSDVLRGSGSSRRAATGSDIINALGHPPSPAAHAGPASNTDDAPTVITSQQRQSAAQSAMGDLSAVAGRRLGHYELIEAVGAGGMAAVLKARDLELGRIVALKILPPEPAHDHESVTRFKQEARAAAMLDHENIARVYSCGEDQGLHFIAFEFVEGINLRQMIDRQGPIPAGDCIRYMIQVAAGLAHAAQRGVVHRDIKPSNIIITPDGRAKIVDMGLARQLDIVPVNGGVTQSGVTLGTFDYISPEQALDPRKADVRSDIYSLGCAFYHALAGRPPVPEGTAAQKLRAHANTDPVDPRQINPGIPDELVLVLARMMAKDPARRYQTPADLIAHLKGVAQRLNLSTEAVGQDSVVRAVAARSAVPQAPTLRFGWVLGAVAVAAAAAAFAMSGGNPPARVAPPPWGNEPAGPRGDPFTDLGAGPTPNPAPPADGAVRTAVQFAARLADADPAETTTVPLAPGAVIDLTTLADPVACRGTKLELVGSASSPAVLRLYAGPADSPAPAGARPNSLSLAGVTELTVTGVRFELVKPARTDEPRWSVWVGLQLPDATGVTLSDCVFANPSGARGVGAVRIGRKSLVQVERCVFASTAFGLWVPGQCDVTVADCGFGPHEAAVQVGDPRSPLPAGEGVAPQAVVRLDRSSFLLAPDAAVVKNTNPGEGGPNVRVTAGYCVFASSGVTSFFTGVGSRRPVVVNSLGTGGDTQFGGDRKNAYYGIPYPLLVADGKSPYLTFRECRTAGLAVADPTAEVLAQRPWADGDPLNTLAGPEPWRAFRLRLADPAVFLPGNSNEKVLGAQFYNANVLPPRRAYPNLQWPPDPPKTPPASDVQRLVWHPKSPDEPLPKDTFTDLSVLLKAARPGAEILIRHDGELPLEGTVDLKPRPGAGEFRVAFKPYEGCKPVFTAPGGLPLDQSVFRLHSGEVSFEGVQFLLKAPRPKSEQIVTAVYVVGGKSCSFKDCVFTLAEEDDSRAAAAYIPDPGTVMAMEKGDRVTPDVSFRQCVLRGKGRGVWVRVGMAVRVTVDETLTALDGPVYLAEPGGKPAPGAHSSLALRRSTVFAGGPVVELHGGKVGEARASGLVPLKVSADECLFAAVPFAGRGLVELDGVDPDEVLKSNDLLDWKVQVANRYANFDPTAAVMVIRPASDGNPKESNWDQWITFAGEPPAAGKPVGRVTFDHPPAGLKDLASLRPADAAVKAVDFPDLTDAKATDAGTSARLPVPAPPAADRDRPE